MDSRHSHRTILVVTALVLLADLASKRWAEAALADGPIDLGVITLRLAQNPGIAFSLGADGPGWVVLLVTSLATVLIAWMAWRGTLHPPVAAGLLLGGGLGNLVDRLVGGTVTDFLDLGWFPSFNVADVALNVGVGLVIVVGLLHGHPDDRDDDGSDDASAAGGAARADGSSSVVERPEGATAPVTEPVAGGEDQTDIG